MPPESALFDDLAGRLSGRLLRPADEGYDAARRVHNGLVDRAPAVIVRCRSADDVAAARALRARRRASTSPSAAVATTWRAARSPTTR